MKVREFDGTIKTNFLGNGLPKENTYYTCIACITIDSVLKMNKKNYLQVYLETCQYKVKKKNTYIKNYKCWIRIRSWIRCRSRFRVKKTTEN